MLKQADRASYTKLVAVVLSHHSVLKHEVEEFGVKEDKKNDYN